MGTCILFYYAVHLGRIQANPADHLIVESAEASKIELICRYPVAREAAIHLLLWGIWRNRQRSPACTIAKRQRMSISRIPSELSLVMASVLWILIPAQSPQETEGSMSCQEITLQKCVDTAILVPASTGLHCCGSHRISPEILDSRHGMLWMDRNFVEHDPNLRLRCVEMKNDAIAFLYIVLLHCRPLYPVVAYSPYLLFGYPVHHI